MKGKKAYQMKCGELRLCRDEIAFHGHNDIVRTVFIVIDCDVACELAQTVNYTHYTWMKECVIKNSTLLSDL